MAALEGAQSRADSTTSSMALPTLLYPLDSLVEEVLSQERALWARDEAMLESLGVPPSDGVPEETIDGGSEISYPSSRISTPTNSTTNGLPLIKYGQLTNTIHKYFRKLEKRHACLHLTARRAKHDTLRHVERSVHEEDPNLLSTTSALTAEGLNGTVLELRDEERLVYRCALMCAQFPMLSAPDPPDGQSPSPPLPPLPTKFETGALGSLRESDLARTAPAELAPNGREHNGLVNGVHRQESSSDSSQQGDKRHCVSGGSVRGKPHDSHEAVDGVNGGRRRDASDPIPIKNSKPKIKTRSIKRTSITKAAIVESDSEDELVAIVSQGSKIKNNLPSEREDPFSPMVNREMLCNLVRRSFGQSEEQQLMFEQALRQEYSRRTKGEILAKELVGQLQVLENNGHPFYKPKLFVTRNGYDLWLQAEKQRVKGLIDKFWHFSLPRPQQFRHYSPTDHHKAYSTLLQKIITAESRTTRREPVHMGRTPSSPLSPTAQRLLNEFGLRYGVGELYRKIVYLDYLAKHFDYEIWYICHCIEELQGIRALLPRNRNKITAVRREMEMLRSTVHLLHGQCDNSLTRIDRLFLDSDSKRGVASLMELLAEVLDAEQTLFGKKVGLVDNWLKRYLKSGFALRYERRKEIANVETAQGHTAQPFMLTPTLVNSLLLDTREEVLDYREKYQDVFRPYFDIVPFAQLEFYRLLCSDACSLCAGLLHRSETRQKMSLEVLGLMYRLNERDVEWEGVISPGLQLWRRHFSDLALVWMEVLGKQIQKWVVESVAKDQWMSMTFSAHTPHSRLSTPFPPSTPTHITHTHRISPKFTKGIRTSPFPSPNLSAQERKSAFSPAQFTKSSGAFSPYNSYVGQLLRRTETPNPSSEEGSGAVTDSSSSQTTVSLDSGSGLLIAGGVPLLADQLPQRSVTDSLLNFGQERGALVGSGTEANQIEVAVSVYSGCESEHDEPHLCQISPSPTVPPQSDHTHKNPPSDSKHISPVNTSDINPAHPLSSSQSQMRASSQSFPSPKSADNSLKESLAREGSSRGHLDSNSDPPAITVVCKTDKSSLPEPDASNSDQQQSYFPTTDPQSLKKAGSSSKITYCDEEAAGTRVLRLSGQQTQTHTIENGSALNGEGANTATAPMDTVSKPSSWKRTHIQTVSAHGDGLSAMSGHSSSPERYDQTQGGFSKDDFEHDNPVRPLSRQSIQSYFFPVSNSPVDIVTMLTRLACFTGTILNVLTPRLPRTSLNQNPSHEYAPEVAQAREQAKLLLTNAENNRTEFLRKMHKIMLDALKLYADNLICMDLCCFSGGEASTLVGEQKLEHLKRRKTANEVWGCRHMVEAKHGLHPNGMPCQKKTSKQFESITRDMCIRINNLHTLIATFPSLENHLYLSMRTSIPQPATAHGYVSSDPGELSPQHPQSHSFKPNPHSTRPLGEGDTLLSPSDQRDGILSAPSSISLSLGPMEPDTQRGRRNLPAVGFKSKDSKQVLEYLQNTQKCQLKLLCLRMNKFFKPALSLLLELKLVDYPLDKRLLPLLTFLERHRLALKKYLYPACFNNTMEYLWDCILRDLEGEAIQLKSKKRPVTERAQMLLQALSILLKFMHQDGQGLPLDTLTGSSVSWAAHLSLALVALTQCKHEYLLGLLDIMTRSTDQLIKMFNQLSAPQFSNSQFDLSHSPVPIDTRVLQYLRSQLHRYKKCFSGHEFVLKVLKVGSMFDFRSEPSSTASTPIELAGRAGISPSGRPVEYTISYATELGQFLLTESVLIELPNPTNSLRSQSDGSLTPIPTTDDEGSLRGGPEVPELSDGLSTESQLSISSQRQQNPRQNLKQQTLSHSQGGASVGASSSHRQQFCNDQYVFYKFADSEDADSNSLYNNHILSSLSLSQNKSVTQSIDTSSAGALQERHREFNRARQGTLYLVYDILVQRNRKERRAKQFLQMPRALEVAEQKRRRAISCDLIFKM